tara:strand:+ start:438 stop:752 length:315 start_codon:yes stop_codon:yes gene_type:complete
MSDSDEKKDLITILKGEKRTWLATIEYFPNNIGDYKEYLANDTLQVVFKVKANSEEEAREKSIEIYENEFGIESKQIAQQNIEDTDALELRKFVDGKCSLNFKE